MKTYEERMEAIRGKLKKKQIQRKAMAATASALCICLVVGLLLPHAENERDTGINISKYADSEYFKVIEAINRDIPEFQKPTVYGESYGNGSTALGGAVADGYYGVPEAAVPGATPDYGMNADGNTNSSVEVTDHQVAGVLEADIIKRSQTHIFYLKGNILEIYPIAGEETKLLGTWKLNVDLNSYYSSAEMYLSADATRLNIIAPGSGTKVKEKGNGSFVQVISLDVSDPANIKEMESIYVTGNLLSSRMVGEQMLLMAKFTMNFDIDFEDESTFLPQIGTPGNMKSIPADNIIIPDKLDSRFYTVVVLLDENDMSVVDSGAFMSASTDLYVSKERIYATRSYTTSEKLSDTNSVSKTMTEISCMAYDADGLGDQGTFCVEGIVKDQYSMDEHDGIFRVVTGTNYVDRLYGNNNASTATISKRNANLTCFKVGSWELVAQVEQFAPEGETVSSVRFDGDYAYVCTAVVVSFNDPVFFFDMTDLSNITVKDTGTIDGYSSSLIQLEDGFMMGIGMESRRTLKLEIYEETDMGVASVCEYVQNGNIASNYKAYYIDRENNLFGIPTSEGYILLHFDGCQLRQLANVGIIGTLEDTRGIVIDGFLYVFSYAFWVQSIV